MKSKRLILCGLLLSIALTLPAQSQVTISELMAANTKTLADQDRDYSDWIEIHNPGLTAVNLEGWYLTDATNQLAKWRFPSTTLAANGYLVVFASGKNRAAAGAQLHTGFNLDADGEYLALVRPDGTSIAAEFAPQFPEQFADLSYGSAQGAAYYFSRPTPGAANGATGFIAVVADTRFSQDRGFYELPFDLTISTATTNALIRYSTNGIPPSATNGAVYTGPIPISGTTTIRAAAFKDGFLPSNVDTHTYLFLDDVIRQSPTGQPPPGWPSTWGSNARDYGMDPDVVNNSRYSATIKNDLKTIPSFSVVMNLGDLFNATTGIYANPAQEGINWERPCSVELINPDGSQGFQINAGIRIRGGFSRSTSNPKHAFRLFFRQEFGAGKLKYPLFGDDGADTFDGIDLRTFQNYSWSFQGDAQGVFIRDQFSRDAQTDMGYDAERGHYYHLYINGQYWGLFNTCERPEASYGATYWGGDKDDYDVIKVEAGPYTIWATDGDLGAWTRLYNAGRAGLATDEAYQRIQGNNPDGTPNPAYENLLDVPNMIDYMLVIFYGGNLDAPVSNFLGNTSPNNWYGVRNRNGPFGFRFFAHDAEHTLLDVNQDRTGPWTAGDSNVNKSSPQWIFQKCQANLEFRMLVADHVHRHFFNNGALTPTANVTRFMRRKNEIDRAVVGESARWGDAKRGTPLTRDTEWMAQVNRIVNTYFPQRTGNVITQMRRKNLYPNTVAPAFNQHGGNVSKGFSLTMTAPAGTVYYTLDGSDPRLRGGAVSPTASTYRSPLTLNESVRVKSRVFLSATNWSALNEASFTIIQTFTELLITEIMYRPPDRDGLDGDDFEFIELKNVAPVELDLSGVHFTNGVNFTFPNGARLGPGRFAVLVSHPAAFTNQYPGVRMDGVYQGRLANGGENVSLVHAVGTPIFTVEYGDQAPWPLAADGDGFSLVPINPNLNPDPASAANWRASSKAGGSPGADDPPVSAGEVWINEVLTHTDPPQVDAIELHNPTANPVEIGNWFLTDSRTAPKKFKVPAGTVISAGGYLVFTETDFNPRPGVDPSFTLSSHGEEIYLFAADASGNLTGYSDGFSFSAAANGVAFGRHVTSAGDIHYPAQSANSPGSANAGPRIGPVVINEIGYHPKPGGEKFVELKNLAANPVKFFDPDRPANTWRLSGVDFVFPPNFELPARGLALVVAGDPGTFRARNSVPAEVPVFGPFPGVLQANGELLQLLRPDVPEVDLAGVVFVPYLVVDEVRYDNQAPWPVEADGLGPSLERVDGRSYGNDPINWRANPGGASAGFENGGNRIPRVNAGADVELQAGVFPAVANLTGTASDDGLPRPPGALRYTWSQVSGPAPAAFANPNQLSTGVSFPGVGAFLLRLTANDGELESSDEVSVVIARAPALVTMVQAGAVWKYWDQGTDLGTAWRQPGFNDGAWASGKAHLGYGDGDEATVVSFGPNGNNKYLTTYFRLSFPVTGARSVTLLTAKLLRDDGGVVYLNGTEVFRSNMPEGDISFASVANGAVPTADESTVFYEKNIDPAALVEGANVLAVEIHQSGATSSDLSFDFALTAMVEPANQPPFVDAGKDLELTLPAGAALDGSIADDGLPAPPGKFTSTWAQISGPGTVTFDDATAVDTVAHFTGPGVYVLRLVAADGGLFNQDEVTVTVNPEEGLAAWKARYFSPAELAAPSVSGDNADPDGDGHSNFEEYIAGTGPRDAGSVLKVESTEWLGVAGLNFRVRFNAAADKSYSVFYRDSLSGGSWLRLKDVPAQTTARVVEVTDSITGNPGARYYRLVTPQPP